VLELMLRIGFSLLVVFALMWGLAKVARKPMAGRAAGTLAVIGRQQLTRGASVAVVRVADRTLIIGVTDTQVTLLGETEESALTVPSAEPVEVREPVALPAAPAPAPSPAPGGALDGSVLSPRMWSQTVQFLRERTVRR
jgi:flagellar protein FliO/FliZ